MALVPADSDERVFVQIVEAGSLKAAAERLRTDPSSVSRRLAALEGRLGVQLMRRSTRGSRPTEAAACEPECVKVYSKKMKSRILFLIRATR